MRKIPTVKSGGGVTLVQNADGSVRVACIKQGYTFAYELRNAARVMANSARAIEEEPDSSFEIRAFVHGAIILAYASLEAALNETIHLNALRSDSPLSAEDRRVLHVIGQEELQPRNSKNTLQMFNMLLRFIGRPELSTNENPYQAANLVRQLRNILIHPVPGQVVTYVEDEEFDYSSQQGIVKKLKSHLGLTKEATFPDQILTKECASWAVGVTEAFLHEFVTRSGINPGFDTGQ